MHTRRLCRGAAVLPSPVALRATAAVGSVVIGLLLAWELGLQARALL